MNPTSYEVFMCQMCKCNIHIIINARRSPPLYFHLLQSSEQFIFGFIAYFISCSCDCIICLLFPCCKINCAAASHQISPKGTTKFHLNLMSYDSAHLSSFQLLCAKPCFPHISLDGVSLFSSTPFTLLNCILSFPPLSIPSSFCGSCNVPTKP